LIENELRPQNADVPKIIIVTVWDVFTNRNYSLCNALIFKSLHVLINFIFQQKNLPNHIRQVQTI